MFTFTYLSFCKIEIIKTSSNPKDIIMSTENNNNNNNNEIDVPLTSVECPSSADAVKEMSSGSSNMVVSMAISGQATNVTAIQLTAKDTTD